ncbi:hypothetical protein J6590_042030 [Homalodisca vitripennis]|nr:hypothetical protein J6590_052541 [Homalodisca vitripennis]KAG8336513.1 hypothetical protein J6590_042030 [Homalodisca vitripennis]
MAVITEYVLVDLTLAIITLSYLLYRYITGNDDYWDKRGVPNLRWGFICSTLMGKRSQIDEAKHLYNKFSGQRYFGLFQIKNPVLMVRDPKLINLIMAKDFSHFQDRGIPQPKHDPLSKSVSGLRGQTWRALRYKLTPIFTTGKLRGMFQQVFKCGDCVMGKIEKRSPREEIDSRTLLYEYSMHVISSCAFGIQAQPESAEFDEFKSYFEKTFSFSFPVFFKFIIVFLLPKVAEVFKMCTTPSEVINYFIGLTKTTIKYRKDNGIHRNDFFQLLLKLKEQEESGKDMGLSMSDATEEDAVVNQMQYTGESNLASASEKLFTDEMISANTFVFLVGGADTVLRTISFVLFALTQYPDVQQKVQQEVDSVMAKHGGLSFDSLREMTYMDLVIQETQRLYPILALLSRECTKDYKIPDSDLTIEKGVLIMIPVVALHHDPQYYPDPEQFKPERFQGNNFKPNPTFLPFGDGPRICIGMRFALMEVKSCLARIMSQYSVKLSSKTPVPLKFKIRAFMPTVDGEIWLQFKKRNNQK